MKFQWNGWANVMNRINTIYNQQDMVCRSCILVSLILSSCSLEYGGKKYLMNWKGYQGISSFWHINQCPSFWSVRTDGITACFPKKLEEENCILLSLSYNISEAKEVYVNIKTETRDCAKNIFYKCTGKFNLSVHYQINENDFKRVILPNILMMT